MWDRHLGAKYAVGQTKWLKKETLRLVIHLLPEIDIETWNLKSDRKEAINYKKNRYPFSAWDRHLFIKSPIGHIKRAKNDHLHQN